MKKYRLSFEYLYTKSFCEEIEAHNDEEAKVKAKKIIEEFEDLTTNDCELIYLGDVVDL